MTDDPVEQLERMFRETGYSPSLAYSSMTAREPERFYDLRCSKVSYFHPQLSQLQVEKLLLRVWLQLSMDFDNEPFTYAEYIDLQDEWVDVLADADTSRLLDIISIIDESLIT